MNDVSRTHRPNPTTPTGPLPGRMFWASSNGTYRKAVRKLSKIERRRQRRARAKRG